jgi:hypothetical protein
MAAQTTHLVSKTQSCKFGAFLRELGWEIKRIPGPITARAGRPGAHAPPRALRQPWCGLGGEVIGCQCRPGTTSPTSASYRYYAIDENPILEGDKRDGKRFFMHALLLKQRGDGIEVEGMVSLCIAGAASASRRLATGALAPNSATAANASSAARVIRACPPPPPLVPTLWLTPGRIRRMHDPWSSVTSAIS